MVAVRSLLELQEVDHLVIPPVADEGPGIIRIDGLPFEALPLDAIGVVAIRGGGVRKLEDHAFEDTRVGKGQRFPILEDVAPIALVVQHRLALGVLEANRE